jgi:hypothetical protein
MLDGLSNRHSAMPPFLKRNYHRLAVSFPIFDFLLALFDGVVNKFYFSGED